MPIDKTISALFITKIFKKIVVHISVGEALDGKKT